MTIGESGSRVKVSSLTTDNSIGDYISDPTIRFRMPLYQRPYTWSKENVVRFVDSLHKSIVLYAKSSPTKKCNSYDLGTITVSADLTANAEAPLGGEDGGRLVDIIDGQQRITTAILAMVAAELCDKEKGLTVDTDIVKKYFSVRKNKLGNMEPRNASKILSFSTGNTSEEFLSDLIGGKQPDPYKKAGYAVARDALSHMKVAISKMITSLYEEHQDLPDHCFSGKKLSAVKIVDIVLSEMFQISIRSGFSSSQAPEQFENLNNSTTELTTSDMIKAYLLSSSELRGESLTTTDCWKAFSSAYENQTSPKVKMVTTSLTASLLNWKKVSKGEKPKVPTAQSINIAFTHSTALTTAKHYSESWITGNGNFTEYAEQYLIVDYIYAYISNKPVPCPKDYSVTDAQRSVLDLIRYSLPDATLSPVKAVLTAYFLLLDEDRGSAKKLTLDGLVRVLTTCLSYLHRYYLLYKTVTIFDANMDWLNNIYSLNQSNINSGITKFFQKQPNVKVASDNAILTKIKIGQEAREPIWAPKDRKRVIPFLLAIEFRQKAIRHGTSRLLEKINTEYSSLSDDHIIPQKKADADEDLSIVKHCIGNRALITKSENSSLADADFDKKRGVYEDSSAKTTQTLAKLETFETYDDITRRELEIIQLFLDSFPLVDVPELKASVEQEVVALPAEVVTEDDFSEITLF